MARAVSNRTKLLNTAVAGTFGFLMFFPILWIVILSFKTEEDAIRAPLEILFESGWTTDSFAAVQARSDYLKHFLNSVIISVGSTLLGLLIAVPAACVDVDALNQDVATRWRVGSDLPAFSGSGPAGHPFRADDRADAD